MKPPYEITAKAIQYIASISEKAGEVNAKFLVESNPKLRKQNRIRTIHSTLHIEGNTLSEQQITAILENKRVIGPPKDITEVLNAEQVYQQLDKFKYHSEKDFLKAHKILMGKLITDPGKYRKGSVGIVKGQKLEHMAPSHKQVPYLMQDLFNYVKDKTEIALVKSCVFHYEMEFIHPFMDGNGRMGRLWQTLILMEKYPVFRYLPFETLISNNQTAYYKALSNSDKAGSSTPFIEYMLSIIDRSLDELLENSTKRLSEDDRLQIFLSKQKGEFSRKDYMDHFKELSTATASRDLKRAVEERLIIKKGDKKTAVYLVNKKLID